MSPAADEMLSELSSAPAAGPKKVRYTHQAMIDLILANPWISQGDLAKTFGYTESWVSTVIASDAFQSAMAARREEIINPELKATLEERFKILVHKSLTKLNKMLEHPDCPPQVALRAAELGAKGVGLGGFGREVPPPPAPAGDRLELLAQRLIALKRQTLEVQIEGQVLEVSQSREAA